MQKTLELEEEDEDRKKVLQNKQSNCLQHFPGIYGKDLVIAHPTGGGSGGIFLGCEDCMEVFMNPTLFVLKYLFYCVYLFIQT